MTDRATAITLLRRQLDDDRALFRDGQWEAIDSIVNHQARLLVVQRTGWGKSSVYFIATRMLRDLGRGPTLIVSPLLALMRNQIAAAERLGIRAVTINSTKGAALLRRAISSVFIGVFACGRRRFGSFCGVQHPGISFGQRVRP